MPATAPLATILARLSQDTLALASATEEISIWISQHGSTDASVRIEDHLKVIQDNADVIAESLVELIACSE